MFNMFLYSYFLEREKCSHIKWWSSTVPGTLMEDWGLTPLDLNSPLYVLLVGLIWGFILNMYKLYSELLEGEKKNHLPNTYNSNFRENLFAPDLIVCPTNRKEMSNRIFTLWRRKRGWFVCLNLIFSPSWLGGLADFSWALRED